MSIKILTVCPSNNPKFFGEMFKSFRGTSTAHNELIINRDTDKTITQIINKVWEVNRGYDFYHITNDDVIYHTKGWDSKFIDLAKERGPGVYYGNDLFMGENLATFPFISGKLVEAVGFLQEPSLIRYYGDTVWSALAKECKCLHYVPEVIIEHKTFFNGKREGKPDAEAYKKDSESFHKWATLKAIFDLAKVREVLNDES